MNPIITKNEQKQIIKTIKALSTNHDGDMPERSHLLFMGVYIGLGDRTPPHWVMNIMAGATDRLLKEVE